MAWRWRLTFWRWVTRVHDELHAARDELWNDYKPWTYPVATGGNVSWEADDIEWTVTVGADDDALPR